MDETFIKIVQKFFNEGKTYREILEFLLEYDIRDSKGKKFTMNSLSRKCNILIDDGVLVRDKWIRPSRRLNDRVDEIVEMLNSGMTLKAIGEKYNVSKQRIYQICREENIIKRELNREINKKKYGKIVDHYNDKANKTCFVDIRKEIRDNGHDIGKLRHHGLKLDIKNKIEKRDSIITEAYKNGSSAKNIIGCGFCGINTISSVYRVVTKNNAQKYPKIKRGAKASKNLLFEDEGILRKIIQLRDEEKLSFLDIAKLLNSQNYKSFLGKSFSDGMVWQKYYKYRDIIKL